jgi:hypothetical protein
MAVPRPLRHRLPVEIRTAAGPSSAVQRLFNGGPYTTASHVRQCQLVCPPPRDPGRRHVRRGPGSGQERARSNIEQVAG